MSDPLTGVLDLLTRDFTEEKGPDTHLIPEICVIGAGSSGITVAKALHQRGIAFDCFEKGSDIGGMWRYENDNGLSSAYASLHIDTSRDNLGYSDFPIPRSMPDFLSHAQFLKYLESYADHFGVRKLVTFKTAVEAIREAPNGRWNVHLSTGEVRSYAKVIIANGHLWDPRTPAFPGQFSGETIHSHYYRTAAPFEGKSVLVVGLGNSAVDIAVDLARHARVHPPQRLDHAEISDGVSSRSMVGFSVQATAPADASDAQNHVATDPAWSRRSATVRPEKTGASDVARARHAQPGTIAISRPRLDFRKA